MKKILLSIFLIIIGSAFLGLAEINAESQVKEKKPAILVNDTGKTIIRKIALGNEMSMMIISKKGTVIVCDPMQIPGAIIPDLIIITHDHHIDRQYLNNFPNVKKSVQKVESFTYKDIKITGIAASHTGAQISTILPDMVTYILEMDGLRIAYFACIGQSELTKEQLTSLGKIDIALITTDDYPGFIAVNKAKSLIGQLKPQITIPLTHGYSDYTTALQKMSEVAGPVTTIENTFVISKEDLKDSQQKIIDLYFTEGAE